MSTNSPHKLRRIADYFDKLLVLTLVLLTTGAWSQSVTQYTFTSGIETWSAISGGVRLNTTTSSFDDQTYTIDPVANVLFAGTSYNTLFVSANGFVTFNNAPSGSNFTPIESSSTGYTGAISAFGCDIENASSGTREIRWQEVGSEVVVQWLGARRAGQSESISFQIRINTTNGVIKTVYNASTPSGSTNNYPQVGLRGPNNSTYNNRSVEATSGTGSSWANSAAGNDNFDECRYNNTAGRSPANGLTFTWTPPCLPPTTSTAGSDQTICFGGAHVLSANVPSIGTGAWSINSVSGGATNNNSQFSSLSANNATFTPLTAGVYTLRWTISNGVCTASTDDIVLTVRAQPTTANAGGDQIVCASPGTATLAGNTITLGTGTWSKTSPGAGGSITTPNSPNSGITGLTVAGSPYTFRWTATNAPCASNFDEMTITVIPAPTTSNAGGDQTICLTDAQVLTANVPSVGTGVWSISAVSGGATNNTSQFSSLSTNNATFTPLTAGVYTLRWSITNGVCAASADDMILTVRAIPTTANAGGDQEVCANPGTATLAGNTITSGSGTWTKTSPGAGGNITTPGSPTTGITGLTVAGSPYTFRWTASNSPCASNFDEMTIVVNPNPTATPTSSTPICVGSPFSLNGNTDIGTSYSWSGPNGFASTDQNPTLGNAALAMGGTYSFTATANSCPTTGTVSVAINPVPASVTANSTVSSVCSTSNTVNLTSSTATTATLLSEGWNSGTGGWTTANTSTGGNVADAAWTIRPNAYFYNASSGADPTFNSNDNTAFFLSNSDDQGSGTTATTLTSPAFSTAGYSAVSMTFYHHYRFNSGASDRAFVEVSTDNTSWTTVTTYSSTQGAVNGFVQATANLNSVAGQPTVYVRFRYAATWDWWWAIDNVNITATFSTPVSYAWTSTPTGFASASQNPTGVAVTEDRTYLVTVTTPAGCTADASVAVDHVQAPVAGSNNTLTICSIDAAVDMSALLGAHDAGNWSGPSPVVGDLYDPATMSPGEYVYTVSAPPCANATATISVTENAATPRYADVDGDGFGDASDMVLSCEDIIGRVSDNTDCNDDMVMYADNDGDGFGAGNPIACGGIADNTDCNDAEVQYADGDGDGFGAGSPVACGVANDDDCNDDELQYADTDGDGFGAGSPVACGVANNTDDCPSVVGLIGSNCDAQPGTGFVLGQLNGSCNCVAIACTQTVVLELRSDANSAQIGYEILDQNTELVICSGGAPNEPFPNGITTPITPSCCLPVGCYRLRVLDAGGDGFVSGGITGGYQLRESGANGRRIIDNLGNFTTGGTSAIASTYQNGAFCVPISNDRPIFTSCDKLDWVPNKFIVATPNDDVTAEFGSTNSTSGYDFWFFDPNGTYSFRRFRSHATSDGTGNGATRACHFRINGWANTISSPHIPADVLLNVRVRARVAGENRPYGPACLFKIDVVRAACPMVKLQDNPLNEDHSCGVSRQFGGSNSAANKLVAAAPQFTPTVASGNVRYQFRFRLPGEFPNPGSCIVRPIQSSPTLYLNWTNGDKLKCNTQYQVDVRVSKDGGATWCIADGEPTCSATPTVWGKVCNVNITTSNFCPGEVQGGSSNLSAQSEGDFTLYPNPNTGEQLFVNFSAVEKGTNTVNVDIFDMTGKRVIARTIAVQDGFVKASFDLNGDVQSGVYIVNVTAGTKTYTQRLVIQR